MTVSAQGIASPSSYILRDCILEEVSTNGAHTVGIYIQCSVGDCSMDGVRSNFVGAGAGIGNMVVRINGQIFGNTTFKRLTASGDAGVGVYVAAATGAVGVVGLLRLEDLHLAAAGTAVAYLSSVKHVSSLRLTATSTPSSGIKTLNGTSPANVTNESLGVHAVVN